MAAPPPPQTGPAHKSKPKPKPKKADDEAPLPAPPQISIRTQHMTGLLVDVYGLAELPPSAARVSCLWLHHPRTRSKETMADIAARCVAAWNDANTGAGTDRGLIALAFDQRNHGSRLVHELANASWREGNATHAQDMFGVIAGAVADQAVLLDAVGGYLFHDHDHDQEQAGKQRVVIDQHLALGVSLGGHSVWQAMFADPRIRAGVVVIGCPDFMNLISDRARRSRLATYSAAEGKEQGASFLGSKDFPLSLVEACQKLDPKAILFGTAPVPSSSPSPGAADDNEILRQQEILHERLHDKKFLLCSGGDDKLVPYRCAEPFMQWFKAAIGSQFKDENIDLVDKVYPGIGHEFSTAMIRDAVQFVTDVVASAGRDGGSGDEQRASKI
ncbi:hypothetical protein B0T22DRAFT_196463 [Podospora appendiculata]|uniref:Uncharacterized protein n=1 Tax=Podospora appendiculata TaxID=314037 RepID=A0AAE0X4K5_9PEZI|nr:hypothetical protein B0T22DRAFT_196463 [Podospora appendiculata]